MSTKSVRLARRVAQCRRKRGADIEAVRILLTPDNAKGPIRRETGERPGFADRLTRVLKES